MLDLLANNDSSFLKFSQLEGGGRFLLLHVDIKILPARSTQINVSGHFDKQFNLLKPFDF